MTHPALQRIGQLQAWRGRRPFDPSIAGFVSAVADGAQRTQRRLGELAELWQELLPPEIANQTALAGLRGGVLQVTADSSAVSFELDRLLRGGVEADLRRRYRGTLVRIRIRVEQIAAGANAARNVKGRHIPPKRRLASTAQPQTRPQNQRRGSGDARRAKRG